MSSFRRLCLIGLNRVVASFALDLKRIGFRGSVGAMGELAQVGQAWRLGAVTGGAADLHEVLPGADLVVIAGPDLPAGAPMAQVLEQADEGAVIADWRPVKGTGVRELAESGRTDLSYVGLSLLGPLEGDNDLPAAAKFFFESRAVALAPRGTQDEAGTARLRDLLTQMGARVTVVNADVHDRMLAYTAQLPRLLHLARIKACQAAGMRPDTVPGALDGWFAEELRELAAGQKQGWLAEMEANRAQLAESLMQLARQLLELKSRLCDGQLAAELASVQPRAGEVDGPALGGAVELVLVARGEARVLERAAGVLAMARIPVGTIHKIESAEAGTYKVTLNSPRERDQAAGLLRRAGIEVVDLSA